MFKTLKLFTLTSVLAALQQTAFASTINLQIEGEGAVYLDDEATNCESECAIVMQNPLNSLSASAAEGWQFSGWQGQKCDAGDEVLFEEGRNSIFGVTGGAKTLAAGDLNNDGLVDLVSISLFDGQVHTLINQNDGRFLSQSIARDLAYPASLDLHDWDGDGDTDLLVAVFNSSHIAVFLNDGNGKLTPSDTLSFPGYKPYAIAVADKNDDGLPDILVSSFNADTSGDLFQLVSSINNPQTLWFENTGNGFQASTQVSDHAAITLDVAVNNESETFVIAAAEIASNAVSLYQESDSQVTRNVIQQGNNPYGAALGDLDDDGMLDVLIASYLPSSLSALYGTGNDAFADPVTILTAEEGLTATAIADLNSDGYQDVATGEFNANRFFSVTTASYKNCIVSDKADISLTAVFKEIQTSEPVAPPAPSPTPSTPPSPAQSSGGGYISPIWLLLLIASLSLRKLRLSRKA